MKKSKSLEFSGKRESSRVFSRIAVIIAALLLAGAASFVVILAMNDFDISKFAGTRSPGVEATTGAEASDTSAADETEAPAFSDEGAVNFLFVCHKDKTISFCSVISASVKENAIRVKPVSPEIMLNYGGQKQSLADIFKAESPSAAAAAIKEKGISISRYVSCTEADFKKIMQRLGSVEITLDRDLLYTADSITYTLSKGTQSMTGDILLRYMSSAALGEELLKLQALAGTAIISTHFTVSNIEKGETLFSYLINLVDTDITAFDYAAASEALLAFAEKAPRISAIS